MTKNLTASVIYQGDLRTKAQHLASGNTFITDAPIDNHGKGEAFSPTDLVATALASCMMTIIGIKAEAMALDMSALKADVTKIMSASPRRIAEVQITLFMPAALDAKSRKILEAAAHTCPVAASLHPETKQTIVFTYV